ncbi:hypothetical protein A9Q99_22955 [Gammaproteobacteria bacterium 45_16_T64]|nr:hypothetical protein A9Q99_22955 [Gammaproteobacteria bacterium 45_16_T64]
MNSRILIIEDDTALSQILAMNFEDLGHEVVEASTLARARELVLQENPDLILMDQGLPDGKGYDLLCEFSEQQVSAAMVMMTAEHDLELAISAIKVGAFDFIHKPIKTEELNHTISRALEHQKLSRQVEALGAVGEEVLSQPRLLGQSQAMLNVSKEIALIAESPSRVLITGESGTGKELIASAIHYHSHRSGPFIALNCAALVDNLLESELFGHEKGAFTGAVSRKPGKFEVAVDGTLFLDEIGEMALPLQAKLLRVLQEGTFERIGGHQQLYSNARIIAATNRNLLEEVAQGRFREDLYYRLNALGIHLPPLRERSEDIPLLIDGLLARICRAEGKTLLSISSVAQRMLQRYEWPGNIRELENILTQAVIRSRGATIEADALVLPGQTVSEVMDVAGKKCSVGAVGKQDGDFLTLDQVEAIHIQDVLDYTEGHKGNACKILDISRPALDRKINRYDLLVAKKMVKQ